MNSHVPLRRMSAQSKNIFMTSHCLKIKKQKRASGTNAENQDLTAIWTHTKAAEIN